VLVSATLAQMSSAMDLLWPLKDRIVSGNRLVQIDNAIYRTAEVQGELVRVTLEPQQPGTSASTSAPPSERRLSIGELCFAFLKYTTTAANDETDEEKARIAGEEARQAMLDLTLKAKEVKAETAHWGRKVRVAIAELTKNAQLVRKYEVSGTAPQAEMDRAKAETQKWTAVVAEHKEKVMAAKARHAHVFGGINMIINYFTETFDFRIGVSTLHRYAKYGMNRRGPAGPSGGAPHCLSAAAERDLLKVIRFSSDRGEPLANGRICEIATQLRHVEWRAKYDLAVRPLPKPIATSWVRHFRKRMRKNGALAIAETESSEAEAPSAASAATYGRVVVETNDPVVERLKNVLIDLARENKKRQDHVEVFREEIAAEKREGMNELIEDADVEIAEAEARVMELRANREKLVEMGERKAKQAKQEILLPKRSLEIERTVIDRVFNELEASANPETCVLVMAQVEALRHAPRDSFGAAVDALTGPLVGARPTLEVTNTEIRAILETVIRETEARPRVCPRKRKKKQEPI
jgi:hypothetical protein